MTRNIKRNCMIAVAVAAVIAGLTLAVKTAVRHPYPGTHVGAVAHAQAIRAHSSTTSARRGLATTTLEVAQSYLGVSTARLRSELRSGRTLTELADATAGKSADGLLQALVKAKASRLRAALASGRLSKAAETTRMARLNKRAKAQLDRR